MSLLEIENVYLDIENKPILQGFSLNVNQGEVHAIMGPNGSGKSTLSYMLAGRNGYEIKKGVVNFNGKQISNLTSDERSKEGMFLAFQYPVELPGVSSINFLRESVNSKRKYEGLKELNHLDFIKLARKISENMSIDQEMLKRYVNVGFSGGEKKRFEILQMLMLNPKIAILDETDSGLDVDALKIVSQGVNNFKNENNSVVVITHYQRLLDYIIPDYVHILIKGKIKKSGGPDLALFVEKNGYTGL